MPALPALLPTGVHGSRPAASAVGVGALYSCTTHSLIYQSNGTVWSTWATLGGSPPPSSVLATYTRTDAAGTVVNPEPTVNTVVPNIAAVNVVVSQTATIIVTYSARIQKGNDGGKVRFSPFLDGVGLANDRYSQSVGESQYQDVSGVWAARSKAAGTYAIDIRHSAALDTSSTRFYDQTLVIQVVLEA